MENVVSYLSKKGIFILDPNYTGIALSIFEFFTHKKISLSGLIKGKKLEKYLCEITNNIHISSIKLPLIIPTVDLNSGCTIAYTNSVKELKKLDNVIWENNIKLGTAIYASCAIPGIFEPKIISNRCLVDGGVTDVLPTELLSATKEKNIVAVDISDQYEMPDDYGILEIASHSISLMRDCLNKYKTQLKTISIKPQFPDKYSLFSFDLMEDCMKIGYLTAQNIINKNLTMLR